MDRSIWQNDRNKCKLGKLSDIVAVMLPDTISWEIKLENLLPMRAFEWLVILVGSE